MRDKLKLIKELIRQLPEEYEISPEVARIEWFFNIKNDGGLRLTKAGYDLLKNVLELETYIYNIQETTTITHELVLLLDRKLQAPFYIEAKNRLPIQIIFFSSEEAMLANLYGDLKKFLDNY